MKKILVLLLTITLIMMITPITAFGQEEETNILPQEQVIQKEPPQQPEIPENADTNAANQLIDDYNVQVDDYNKYVDEENNRRDEEHDKIVNEMTNHNDQEQKKEEENNNALEAQEKLKEEIATDSQSKLQDQTTDCNNLPDSWVENTEDPVLISIEKDENSTKQYKITNLHIFLKEGVDQYSTTYVNDNGFIVDDVVKNNMVLAEWETVSAGDKDLVTIYSQAHIYKHKGAIFERKLEGYTNGYWFFSQEFISSVINNYQDWDNEPLQFLSYNEGDWYYDSLQNVLNVFIYSFIRRGQEPIVVEKYIPDYWPYPQDVIHLDYLSKLDRLVEKEKTPEKENNTPDKNNKNESNKTKPSKEKVKNKKEKENIKKSKKANKVSKKKDKELSTTKNKKNVKENKKSSNNLVKNSSPKSSTQENKKVLSLAETKDYLTNNGMLQFISLIAGIIFGLGVCYKVFLKSKESK